MFQILNIFVLIIMSYGSMESGIPSIKNFNVFPLLQELIRYNNSYQEFLCLVLVGKKNNYWKGLIDVKWKK